MFHPISPSLSPNTEIDDIVLAIRMMLTPWRWRTGDAEQTLKTWFTRQYSTDHILFYNSGRSAEYEILRAFGVKKGDEVIVQAFTCVAVPNSVLWTGATPVYADIDDTLNLTVETIRKKISEKTKAIIVQHTFGVPAKIDEIVAFARKHSILVIEDCAHALGVSYRGKMLGSWGDAAFFSFGRDKVISSVFGGAAIIRDSEAFQRLEKQYKTLAYPSYRWIAQQLFHPIAFALILPWYTIGIGKVLLVAFQKLGWLSFPVYREEKEGGNPGIFPQKYPHALTALALHQIKKLPRFQAMRRMAANIYRKRSDYSDAIYLRYPIFVDNPDDLIRKAKARGVLLGRWYVTPIDPKGVDLSAAGYVLGSCPNAEAYCKKIVNLPMRVTQSEAKKVMRVIESIV